MKTTMSWPIWENVKVWGVGSTWSARPPASLQVPYQSIPYQPADRFLIRWKQTQEKSWHSSWTSQGMNLGLWPLISKLLMQQQYCSRVPFWIICFPKTQGKPEGISDNSTVDFLAWVSSANCKSKCLPYCLIRQSHSPRAATELILTPAFCHIRKMLWGRIWA